MAFISNGNRSFLPWEPEYQQSALAAPFPAHRDRLGAFVERAEDAGLPLAAYIQGKRDSGAPFVRWVYHNQVVLGGMYLLHDPCYFCKTNTFNVEAPRGEGWPIGISKLFRMYKEAGREFLRHLYDAARDIIPLAELETLAEVRRSRHWDGDAWVETWNVTIPEEVPQATFVILTDVVVSHGAHGAKGRIPPEMMLALQTEISGRLLVDAWSREDRESLPYHKKSFKRGVAHEAWTEMLQERMEILRREYESWNGNAAESLAAVCDELLLISLEGGHLRR